MLTHLTFFKSLFYGFSRWATPTSDNRQCTSWATCNRASNSNYERQKSTHHGISVRRNLKMIPDINLAVIYFHRRNELLHFCQTMLFHSSQQPNVHFTKSADCKSQFWQGSRRGGIASLSLKVLICKNLQPQDVLIIRVRPFNQKLPYNVNSYWNYCCKYKMYGLGPLHLWFY